MCVLHTSMCGIQKHAETINGISFVTMIGFPLHAKVYQLTVDNVLCSMYCCTAALYNVLLSTSVLVSCIKSSLMKCCFVVSQASDDGS